MAGIRRARNTGLRLFSVAGIWSLFFRFWFWWVFFRKMAFPLLSMTFWWLGCTISIFFFEFFFSNFLSFDSLSLLIRHFLTIHLHNLSIKSNACLSHNFGSMYFLLKGVSMMLPWYVPMFDGVSRVHSSSPPCLPAVSMALNNVASVYGFGGEFF